MIEKSVLTALSRQAGHGVTLVWPQLLEDARGEVDPRTEFPVGLGGAHEPAGVCVVATEKTDTANASNEEPGGAEQNYQAILPCCSICATNVGGILTDASPSPRKL
jgi:hypothetical protein